MLDQSSCDASEKLGKIGSGQADLDYYLALFLIWLIELIN